MTADKPVAWMVESGPYKQAFIDLGSANAQVFELRKAGYEVTITPLANGTDLAAAIARANRYKAAWEEYNDRTEWVQASAAPKELGMHRADVLRLRIEQAIARTEAAEADFAHRTNLALHWLDRMDAGIGDTDDVRDALTAIAAQQTGGERTVIVPRKEGPALPVRGRLVDDGSTFGKIEP